MCVTGKLPAALNIQLEYVFYAWGNTQSLWVPLFCHQVLLLSGDAQCYNKGCCECLLVHPTGEKLTFENLPWIAPIPGQTIDRCIKVSCDAYCKLVTINLRSTNWSSNLTLNNVWFPSHGRDFSLDPPPLWKFQSSFIHLLKCLGL